jgi:AraC-like DNA-binding protein
MTGTSFSLQTQELDSLNNLLFFVAPGQVITWEVAEITDGFLLYFKKDFLQLYNKSIEENFPFFRIIAANYVLLTDQICLDLYEDLTRLRKVFESNEVYKEEQLQGLTLAFLFKCKGVFEKATNNQTVQYRQKDLFNRYVQLVNRFYAAYRSIEAYAAMLHVSKNHLSTVIRNTSGKTPKRLLDERIIVESKNLLLYSSLSVAEIAYKLQFSEPTHFIRFFKKGVGTTPAEFRHHPMHHKS